MLLHPNAKLVLAGRYALVARNIDAERFLGWVERANSS